MRIGVVELSTERVHRLDERAEDAVGGGEVAVGNVGQGATGVDSQG